MVTTVVNNCFLSQLLTGLTLVLFFDNSNWDIGPCGHTNMNVNIACGGHEIFAWRVLGGSFVQALGAHIACICMRTVETSTTRRGKTRKLAIARVLCASCRSGG